MKVTGTRCMLLVSALFSALAMAGEHQSKSSRSAPAATVPGKAEVAATLRCLGVTWRIQGDSNENCRVKVAYRKSGDPDWRPALDLLRVENRGHDGHIMDEAVIPKSIRHKRIWRWTKPVPYGNLLAGSILYLTPDTDYEVQLKLEDPDGGAAEKLLKARTRAVPSAPKGGRVLHVYPEGYRGVEAGPSFTNPTDARKAARPGDTLLLHAGVHKTLYLEGAGGAPGKPIVVRGEDRNKVTLKGEVAVRADAAHDLVFEQLTLRGRIGIRADKGRRIVIRGCRIIVEENSGIGVYAYSPNNAARDYYIADNVVLGPLRWDAPKGNVRGLAAEGIMVSGTGHVVCRNLLVGFADALSIGGGGKYSPDGTSEVDVYHNDIWLATDDAIEADSCRRNTRVFENRITNCLNAMSNQPLFGGPCYWVRNVIYNAYGSGYKFNCNPSGIYALHNTIITSNIAWHCGDFRNAFMRNNIYTGGRKHFGAIHNTTVVKIDMDYDGIMRTHGRLMQLRTYDRKGKVAQEDYTSLKQFFEVTGLEEHGIEITMGIFAKLAGLPRKGQLSHPAKWNAALKPDGAAVDVGAPLPNVNEDFAGKAPDLGAYEHGRPAPRYGPSPDVYGVDWAAVESFLRKGKAQ